MPVNGKKKKMVSILLIVKVPNFGVIFIFDNQVTVIFFFFLDYYNNPLIFPLSSAFGASQTILNTATEVVTLKV